MPSTSPQRKEIIFLRELLEGLQLANGKPFSTSTPLHCDNNAARLGLLGLLRITPITRNITPFVISWKRVAQTSLASVHLTMLWISSLNHLRDLTLNASDSCLVYASVSPPCVRRRRRACFSRSIPQEEPNPSRTVQHIRMGIQ